MNSIQDLLKEVKSQVGDLSEEEEEDIYTDIKRGMRQHKIKMRRLWEGMRRNWERSWTNKKRRKINLNHKIVEKDQDFQKWETIKYEIRKDDSANNPKITEKEEMKWNYLILQIVI